MNDPTFQVLNANKGRTNIVPDSERDGLMVNTTKQILDILCDHCGPYAKFAMLVDNTRPDIPPKFTTDGINIVRSIQYHNPMQRIIRDELAHLGTKVESVAGDGTTTTMMLAAAWFLSLNNVYKYGGSTTPATYPFGLSRNISYMKCVHVYKRLVTEVKAILDKYKLTYEDVMDKCNCDRKTAVYHVAYRQAYTSSHGNSQLAEEIAEVFSCMEPEAWPFIVFEQEKVETDRLVFSTIEEDQFVSDALPINNTIMNADAGTTYYQNHVNVFVLHNPLSHLDPLSSEVIRQARALVEEQKRPVLIFCPSGIDAVTMEKLREHVSSMFAVFTNNTGGQNFNDLVALQAVAGQYATMSTKQVAPFTARVSYSNHEIKFNNIYEYDEDTPQHPDVNNDATPLGKMLDDLNGVIDKVERAGDKRPIVMQDLRRMRKLANKLKYRISYVIHVGGSARDNLYAMDVITDVLLAVKSSLLHGFAPAGNLRLYKALCAYTATFTDVENMLLGPMFIYCAREALIRQFEVLFDDNVEDVTANAIGELMSCNLVSGHLDRMVFADTIHEPVPPSNSNIPIDCIWPIQPADIETTFLDTFGDTFLKYLFTKRIVADNSIYVEDEQLLKQ